MSGALFALVCCWSLGRLIRPKTNLSWPLALGGGGVFLSLLVFGLMSLGLAKPAGMAALGVICLFPLLLYGVGPRETPKLPRIVLGILLVYGCFYAVHALAPEIQPDANVYHLQAAAEAKRSGGFSQAISFHERLPQGLEMLFAFGYAFAGSPAAKLIHFAFLVATIPLILELGAALGIAAECSAIAAALYACTPVVGLTGTCAYSDAALVFYTVAAAVLLLRYPSTAGLLLAGAAAGFCYSIKMSGLLIPVLGGLYLIGKRSWRGCLLFSIAALLTAAPWLLRNWIQVGNPFAPLGNALFPNAYFRMLTEARIGQMLRSYGGLRWADVPLELTLSGERMQGLLGPVFLLAPIALLALRRRAGRILLALAALLTIPWFLNMGTRFLMPALPFLALAMVLPLPRTAAYGLLLIHAVTCWPALVDLYAPTAWRLTGFPLKAAFHIEPEPEYLRRASFDYRVAKMVEGNTPAGSKVLDLAGGQQALLDRQLIGWWQSAEGDRLYSALEIASLRERGVLSEIRALFPEQPVRKVHVRQTAAARSPWSILEVELYRGDVLIRNNPRWTLDAWPNVWDAPLAIDHNHVSRWSTDAPARPGMFWDLEFDSPQTLSGVTVVGTNTGEPGRVEVFAQKLSGEWMDVSTAPETRPAINLRRTATRFLRRRGIGYILVRLSRDSGSRLNEELGTHAAEWGLEIAAHEEHMYLLRVPARD